jgi:hypothetical protein
MAMMVHTCPILLYSEEEGDRITAVTLKSAFLVAQAWTRPTVEQGIEYPMD